MNSFKNNDEINHEEICSIKKPNFFIVGAPKCGTTALYEYLRTHPNIYMPNLKEPQYFSQHIFTKYSHLLVRSLEDYLKLFQNATPTQHMIGEATVTYLSTPNAIEKIYEFNPDSKIIVMLRNPIEMVHSLHSHIFQYAESEKDFEKAWHLQESRMNGQNLPRDCASPFLLQYAQIAKYGEQIERLFTIFPREQVKIILFDNFKISTQMVYEDVLAFLGVPSDEKTEFPVINPNTTSKSHLLSLFFRYFRYFIPLKRKLRIKKDILLPKIAALNIKKGTRKPLSPSIRSELIKEFKDDVGKLSILLDTDLSYWLIE